ncbi:MAG: 3-deoxy-D-manno-octulosonic acid transferase [Pseudomonadota bacterium]
MLALYRAATVVGWPLVRLYLARRMARGKEDAARFPERLGRPSRARPAGRLIWLHGASVGESLSLLPLIARILATAARPTHVLVTTGTVTSARLMAERLPPGAFHQYVPIDAPGAVRGFLDHWRPDLVLWTESEFWPNLLTGIARRRIPLALVQGRISDRSLAAWRRVPGLIRELLAGFSLCLGQTEEDARRLSLLGAGNAGCAGNLKFAASPLPVDESALADLRARLNGRPVWVAASTHPGEEEIVARAHRALLARHPGLLTIIVPRHPERGPAIAAEIARMADNGSLRLARRAAGEKPAADTGIYLADTMGELGLFFRLARVAFIGKSLVPLGGQNPLEPARLGCPVVFGPHMGNFTAIAKRMLESSAAMEADDGVGLIAVVDRLLSDAALRARMARAGQTLAAMESESLERTMAALKPLLDGGSHASA